MPFPRPLSSRFLNWQIRSQLPIIDLVAPSTGYTGTSKSVIRLQAMAGDTDGALQGVEFSVNGEPLPTWNAYLDLNDSLPITDGSTITIDDGTGKSPVVFEVDFDEVVFGSGIPQLSQDGSNLTLIFPWRVITPALLIPSFYWR